MTMHAFNSTVLFPAPLALARGDGLIVGQDGFVYGQGDLFTGSTVGNHSILVAGTAAAGGTGRAISLGSAAQQIQLCDITLTETGVLRGFVGLQYTGFHLNLVNAGAIIGEQTAIRVDGGNLDLGNRIVNSGTILANLGIDGSFARTTQLTIINDGLIQGTYNAAIDLGDALNLNDVVVNAGLIIGGVTLGGGNDYYDGRGGRLSGAVSGGTGNDGFRPGVAEEYFDGGTGSDLLDFRSGGGAVEIALDGAWDSAGWAEGDSYSGFERIIGSAQADRIGGDAGANVLNGSGGADVILGQAGHDTLEGGTGADTLTGGSGNDSFLFRRLSDCGDRIVDFSASAVGNNDRVMISATAFGGGLTAGSLAAPLFVARADNLAQDADDRFILRTTDRTLWFDANGTGAGAALLVATLQSGATMTAADIVIF